MKIIDTHTHGYFSKYDKFREEMFERSRKNGVKMQIQIGCDEISSLSAIKLAKENQDMKAVIGIHPCDVASLYEGNFYNSRLEGFENYSREISSINDLENWLEKTFLDNRDFIVGFGESGFDRYHDKRDELVDWQAECLLIHLKLCKKYNLPIVIHIRESTTELLSFFNQYFAEFFTGENPVRGVIHCFSGNLEEAKIFTEKFNFYLGIGGILTYKNTENLSSVIKNIPLEKILTETDAPFLTPENFRKKSKINEPYFIKEVIEKMAEIREKKTEEVAEILFKNAKDFFNI